MWGCAVGLPSAQPAAAATPGPHLLYNSAAIIASWFLVATVFVWRGFRNYKRYKAALEEYRRRDKFANATLKRLATRAAERGEGDAAAYGKGAVGDNSEAGGPGDLELGPVSDWAELL